MARMRRTSQAGFTLIEVGVVAPIIIMVGFGLFQILFSLIHSSAVSKTEITITYDKQAAMNVIESDVKLASGFLLTNDASTPDPYQTFSNNGAWNDAGSDATHRVLILRSFATSDNPLSGSRQPIYEGSGAACSAANLQYNDLLTYTTVYFVKDSTLYRRRLIDTTTATCSSQYQLLSCPTVQALAPATRNAACGADDEIIADNVTSFSVDYYADGAATTKLDAYGSDASSVLAASSANISLTIGRNTGNEAVTGTSQLRIAKLNTGGA